MGAWYHVLVSYLHLLWFLISDFWFFFSLSSTPLLEMMKSVLVLPCSGVSWSWIMMYYSSKHVHHCLELPNNPFASLLRGLLLILSLSLSLTFPSPIKLHSSRTLTSWISGSNIEGAFFWTYAGFEVEFFFSWRFWTTKNKNEVHETWDKTRYFLHWTSYQVFITFFAQKVIYKLFFLIYIYV